MKRRNNKPESEKLNFQIQIRIKKDLGNRLEQIARYKDVSVSYIIRELLNGGLKDFEKIGFENLHLQIENEGLEDERSSQEAEKKTLEKKIKKTIKILRPRYLLFPWVTKAVNILEAEDE